MSRKAKPKSERKPDPSAAEIQLVKDTIEGWRNQPNAPTVRLTTQDKTVTIEPPHNDPFAWQVRLRVALGTMSVDFALGEIERITAVLGACSGGIPDQGHVNSVIAVLDSAKPRNEIEAMLVIQMGLAHALAMIKARQLAGSNTLQQQDSNSNALSRLTKTFGAHCETLAKMRRDGRQKVVVEHVHVHPGAQAIVGSVTTTGYPGGGAQDNFSGQPHATDKTNERALPFAPGQTLPGENPTRDSLPVAGSERERPLSDARRGNWKRSAIG